MSDFKCKKLISSLIFVICFISMFSTISYGDELDNNLKDTMDINVLFTWDDQDDMLGLRPDKMIVKLYANGDFTSQRIRVENRTWNGTFKNLPVYDEDGEIIHYTVAQQHLPNVNTSFEYTYIGTQYDMNSKTYIIYNKYVEKRSLSQEEINVDTKENIYRDPVMQDTVEVLVDESTLEEYHSEEWQEDGIVKYDATPKTADIYDTLKYVYMLVATTMIIGAMYMYKKQTVGEA